jgi:hypothetical protein
MFDTLLLRPSLHCNTTLHFTTLHPTTLHYTSLHFTQLHFTILIDILLPLIYISLPFHLALRIYIFYHSISLHITSTDLFPKIIFKNVNPFTALKYFSPFHFTSLFISFYFILFIYLFTYPINPRLYFTLLFLTTTYFLSRFTFYRLYFPSLVYTFLTLVLKICVLPWGVLSPLQVALYFSILILSNFKKLQTAQLGILCISLWCTPCPIL